jgi:hypothetical protein
MKTLPRFIGNDPMVANLNRMVDALNERTPIQTPELPIEFHPHGFKPKPKPAVSTPSKDTGDARYS